MRRALAPLLALALGAAGCGRRHAYPPPERYLPADASLAVLVPSVGAAARQAGALYRTVAQAPPAVQLGEAYAAVRGQLGFDPLDPRGLEQAGIDPNGAAAAVLGAGQTPLLVLPVLDLGRFDSTAARLARDRMGAAQRVAVKVRGLEVVVFRRDAGAEAAIAYAAVGPHAILSAGPQGPDAVAAAAALPLERSLGASPLWAAARAAVGEGYLATAVARAGSPALSAFGLLRDGAALGVRASATSLGLRLAVLLPPGREDYWKALAPPPGSPAPQEVSRLSPDAAVVARWAGDPSVAWRRASPLLPPDVARSLAAARVDPERELFAAIGPGAALSLSLAPTFTVTEFSSPRFDVRRTDPFQLVRVEAALPARDPSAIRSFFGRLARAGARRASPSSSPATPCSPPAPPRGWTRCSRARRPTGSGPRARPPAPRSPPASAARCSTPTTSSAPSRRSPRRATGRARTRW